ncbi:secreted RxLR effector protein 161-like [Hibiscus syriacus]|uniref:secreted RxLR effector protein 161-like n=1 Tax=Hibiscus syriacus TaxID=106335 RepID=UPI0019244CA8|nr:secreted RxLR effector protein 161-like [Hibiscus syriacus]
MECKEMDNISYASLVESLMYAQTYTRSDISSAVGMLGRYQSNLMMVHWRAAKKVLWCLKCTKDDMITYKRTRNLEVVGYSGSDYVGCSDTRKSIFDYVFLLVGGVVSWKSDKQSVIVTSIMEVEFVACFEDTVQSLWLRNFVDDLGIVGTIAKSMRIYCDNVTVVFFSKNDIYSKGAKHMDLKYLFVKEEMQNQRVQIVHIGTNNMIANQLTK